MVPSDQLPVKDAPCSCRVQLCIADASKAAAHTGYCKVCATWVATCALTRQLVEGEGRPLTGGASEGPVDINNTQATHGQNRGRSGTRVMQCKSCRSAPVSSKKGAQGRCTKCLRPSLVKKCDTPITHGQKRSRSGTRIMQCKLCEAAPVSRKKNAQGRCTQCLQPSIKKKCQICGDDFIAKCAVKATATCIGCKHLCVECAEQPASRISGAKGRCIQCVRRGAGGSQQAKLPYSINKRAASLQLTGVFSDTLPASGLPELDSEPHFLPHTFCRLCLFPCSSTDALREHFIADHSTDLPRATYREQVLAGYEAAWPMQISPAIWRLRMRMFKLASSARNIRLFPCAACAREEPAVELKRFCFPSAASDSAPHWWLAAGYTTYQWTSLSAAWCSTVDDLLSTERYATYFLDFVSGDNLSALCGLKKLQVTRRQRFLRNSLFQTSVPSIYTLTTRWLLFFPPPGPIYTIRVMKLHDGQMLKERAGCAVLVSQRWQQSGHKCQAMR